MTILKKLKDHLVPHKGNNHSPKIFAAEVVGELLLIVMLFQVAFIAHIAIIKNSDFLAAVLPTVLVTMTNADRAEAGVSELQSDALLASAAQMKANDMAEKGYFAHRDPSGRDPWYWFDKAGYEYSYAGENLAIDFSESVDVEKAWMNSPAHKANIMKGKFTKVGIGVAKGTYEGRETTFVVQFFAKPASVAPAPAPVIAAVSTAQTLEKATKKTKTTETKVIPKVKKVPTIPASASTDKVATAPNTINTHKAQVEDANPEPRVLGESFKPNTTNNETVILLTDKEQAPTSKSEMNAKSLFVKFASSPSTWYLPLLTILFIVFGLVFIVAFHTHVTKREVEGITLAISVLVLLSGLMYFNFGESNSALVPSDSQSASVSIVFEDGFYYQD